MVKIELSPFISSALKIDDLSLVYHAQAAKIPERNLEKTDISFHGMKLTIPTDYIHDDLTVKFLNTADWKVRSFFESWSEQFHSVVGINYSNPAVDIINSNVYVYQLGDNGGTIAAYKFENAAPTSISGIDLSMSDMDQPEQFDVVFSYSHAYRITIDTPNIPEPVMPPRDPLPNSASMGNKNINNSITLNTQPQKPSLGSFVLNTNG